ncbi:coiled-coil domain-containing protein 86 [Venturia canescens]|uniref:coiled-coil domain-containing protein 86 n=1 Tax=Venturia canescens TaxID=32260 RepID=UPI001C9D4586|nr:coiled-coil domain-containing protein 86 [Venturia canescens]
MAVEVITMEALLNRAKSPVTSSTETPEKAAKIVKEPEVPRGKPKSGRIWKEKKQRFNSIIKTRGIRLSFEKKQKLREDLKRVKEQSRAIIEERKAQKEAKKQRRIENLKRAEENRKKSEVVQVIKNTAKIKRMKKKQLRLLEKRDTNDL